MAKVTEKKQQKKQRPESWKESPDQHDFPAAASYLSLLFPNELSLSLVEELKAAEMTHRKAKDLIRAGQLPLLPADNAEVAKDLNKVARGELLSPVLPVPGESSVGAALIVADGYHRICASYHLDEDADIPCRLVDRP